MQEGFPVELISSVLSISLVCLMLYRYLDYKGKLDVVKGLDKIKDTEGLTQEDLDYIKSNEKEYKEKVIKAEQNVKVSQPIFILIAGALILLVDFQEAFIHLNVVVVAYLFMQVDRLHKRNLYGFLNQLKAYKPKEETQEQE